MTELEVYKPNPTIIQVPTGEVEHAQTRRIISERAALCAGVSLEPVPLLDLAIILPLHIKMVLDIGKVYGFELSKDRAKEIALELASTIALSYATRVVARSALKVIPVVGALLNAPMVFASTYAIGTLAENYFRTRRPELPPLEPSDHKNWLEQAKMAVGTIKWQDFLRNLEKSRRKT